MLKRCNRCGREKDLREFYRDRSQKDGRDKRCKQCAKEHLAALKERRRDEMNARRRARHNERIANDPKYRERVRTQARENRRRQRSTPEGKRKQRAEARKAYAKRKADPERWKAFTDQARERLKKIRENDPDRYADMLEARRVNRRLRRIANGQAVRDLKLPQSKITVSSAPLKPLVERWITNYLASFNARDFAMGGATAAPAVKELADRAGVSQKMIYRVRNPKLGNGDRILLETADSICCALDIPFELVYGEEGEDA